MKKHEHDCDKCVWLGHYEGHDLYYCNQNIEMPTVIARFGTKGDYVSGLEIARQLRVTREDLSRQPKTANVDSIRALRVAYLIAKDMWLIEAKKQ